MLVVAEEENLVYTPMALVSLVPFQPKTTGPK